MIRADVRSAIDDLISRGFSKNATAKALGVSRPTVRRVLASASAKGGDPGVTQAS